MKKRFKKKKNLSLACQTNKVKQTLYLGSLGHRGLGVQGPRPGPCLPVGVFSLFCCTNRFGIIVFGGEGARPLYLMTYLLNTLVKMFPEQVSMAEALHSASKDSLRVCSPS